MSEPSNSANINRVAIIGAGLMGAGIAQICVANGYTVSLYGRSATKLADAKSKIFKGLQKAASKSKQSDPVMLESFVKEQISLLTITTVLVEAVRDADLVIEAVIEDIALKRQLLSEIQENCLRNAIVVTNTSSIRLKDLADCVYPKSRFGGLHFFNPVPVLKLVEVISADETSEETKTALHEFCKNVGKVTIACKDTPGFVVNRLLIPYLIDSIRMLERGDATKEDIDSAMRFGTCYPMGPLELCDFVGLDTIQNVMKVWQVSMPNDSRFIPCKLLDDLVSQGKHGRKAGEGFYKY